MEYVAGGFEIVMKVAETRDKLRWRLDKNPYSLFLVHLVHSASLVLCFIGGHIPV